MGPKIITHFQYSGIISQLHRTSVTQGFLAGIICVIRGLHEVLSVKAPFTHKIITYRFVCSGELFSVIFTGNFTAFNFWGD